MRTRLFLIVPLLIAVGCAKPHLSVRPETPPVPPVPPDVAYANETFEGAKGTMLFGRSWRPHSVEPRGVLVVMHGLRDHGDRYTEFVVRLVAQGYAVYAFDLRGHGRSSGPRVSVEAFDDYIDDLNRFVDRVRERELDLPLFVFGHSMGAAIATSWAIERRPAIAGLILSAPALRIDAPPIAGAAIFLLGTLAPNLAGLAPSNADFSSDPAVEADMGRDPLIYQPAGPIGTAKGLLGAIERIWAGVDSLAMPLLLLHGTGDVQTAPAGSRDLYVRAASGDKTLRLYPGLAHDLVHEPKRDEVTRDIVAWMDGHTGGSATSFPAPVGERLSGDGRKPSASVAIETAYRRDDADDPRQRGGAGVRVRFLLGERIALPLGLDAELLGGGDFTYRAAVYPLGVGFVHPRGHTMSLGAGAGLSDAGSGTDLELPLALDVEVQLGPVRLLAWSRVVWVPSSDTRSDGTDLAPFADELHVGAALRLGRSHRLWATTNAGTGPYLGITLDQQGGVSTLGAVLGVHLWGGS